MTNSPSRPNIYLVVQLVGLYTCPMVTYPIICTGKHLRHARDHFVLLSNAIASPPPHVLSYDTRSRNTPMESKRHHARDALKEAIAQLEDVVPRVKLDTPMTLNAVTPYMQTLGTSFGREVSRHSKYLNF